MKLEKILSSDEKISSLYVPSCKLCRFFSKPEYAELFKNGKYRFGNLQQYQKMECGDVRADPTEQESCVYDQKGRYFRHRSLDNHYALCFTEVDENTDMPKLKERFGDEGKDAICVSIEDNIELTKKILSAWRQSPDKEAIWFFQWFQIEYTKNLANNSLIFDGMQPPSELDKELYLYQKPKSHAIHKFKHVGNGKIIQFSDLEDYNVYRDNVLRYTEKDWEKMESIVHNFEIEREWRLVFTSGETMTGRLNGDALEMLKIEADYYTLEF